MDLIFRAKFNKISFLNPEFCQSMQKWILRAGIYNKKLPCLPLFATALDSNGLDQPLSKFWAKWAKSCLLRTSSQHSMQNWYQSSKLYEKSSLVWHSSPLWMDLAIWAELGPKRTNISEEAWETLIFLLFPRLYLPIGIWNCPYFGWDPLFDFWLGSIFSQDNCVVYKTMYFFTLSSTSSNMYDKH